jgi:hypothetical protein
MRASRTQPSASTDNRTASLIVRRSSRIGVAGAGAMALRMLGAAEVFAAARDRIALGACTPHSAQRTIGSGSERVSAPGPAWPPP